MLWTHHLLHRPAAEPRIPFACCLFLILWLAHFRLLDRTSDKTGGISVRICSPVGWEAWRRCPGRFSRGIFIWQLKAGSCVWKSASGFHEESDASVPADSSRDTDECAPPKPASVTSKSLENAGFWPRASEPIPATAARGYESAESAWGQMLTCASARNGIRPGDAEQASPCLYLSVASTQPRRSSRRDGRSLSRSRPILSSFLTCRFKRA